MCNTIKDLNLALNHDPSYEVGTLCIYKLGTPKQIKKTVFKKRMHRISSPKMLKSYIHRHLLFLFYATSNKIILKYKIRIKKRK